MNEFKVTGSHVHFKSGSLLKMVLDKYVETTVHKHKAICRTAVYQQQLWWPWVLSRSFVDCKLFFCTDKRVVIPLP